MSASQDPGADSAAAPRAWRERLAPVRELLTTPIGLVAAMLVLGVVLGLAVAGAMHDDMQERSRRAVDSQLLPLAVDADGIWTSSDARASVSEALIALRDGDPAPVERHLEEWLDAYDSAVIRIAGLALPPSARPVQRQVIAGLTLSRDAVELLGHAAEVHRAASRQQDGAASAGLPAPVEHLLVEVGRLRQRSEQMLQGARAASGDLAADDRTRFGPDVGPLPSVTEFPAPPG